MSIGVNPMRSRHRNRSVLAQAEVIPEAGQQPI